MLVLSFVVGLLSCQAHGWSEPQIRANGNVSGSDMIISAGSRLVLVCEGDGPVKWVPRLAKHRRYINSSGYSSTFSVKAATAEFTGTYKCESTNKTASHISSVHVFVKDPRVLFTTSHSSRSVVVKEGENALLPCLLTDPDATDIQLRMENGTAAPPSMNMTFDPRKGMQLWNLLPSYTADYICTGRTGGVERVSVIFSVNVIEKIPFPPYVSLKTNEYVRLVGEKLEINCSTYNPNFSYKIIWTHSSGVDLPIEKQKAQLKDNGLAILSTLTIEAVKLSDSGNITCTGTNDAGANSSTAHLQVIEKPYFRLSPRLDSSLDQEDLSVTAKAGQDVELRVLIEAYPPVVLHQWETPALPNTSEPETTFLSNNHRYEAVLFLKRLNSKEQGQYTFFAKSSRSNASVTFSLHMFQKPMVSVRENRTGSLTCTALGYPAPRVVWYKCQGTRPTCTDNSTAWETLQPVTSQSVQREEFSRVEVESDVTIEPSHQKITVECVALNKAGEDSAVFPIDQSEKLFSAMLSGAIGIMAFLLLLLLILMYRYKQKPKYEIRWKIIEATDGNNYTFIDPTQLPYNEKLEFPRDKLKLGKILGSGAFGKVVEATAFGLGKEDKVTRVAVKMLKASAHSDEKEALMSELKILSHLGQHKNIVNLLGACTFGGPVLVITEYCCHGDLLNFLRSKAETFLKCIMTVPEITEEKNDYKNFTSDMLVRSDSGFSSTCSDHYLEMRPVQIRPSTSTQGSSCEDQRADSGALDMDDLLKFSYQVAQGLDFLAAKNCIHRDVAARNVLLSDGCVAKICDFGLARDIMNDSNYVVKGNARLPVKWMAPESIFDCVYTVQSDVWSYGILLWEIFSLGKSPYPNVLVDAKFYKMIKSGYQMTRPDFASPEMYTIMKMCWNLEPTARPTFGKIGQLVERLLVDTTQQTQYQNVESGVPNEQQLETCDPAKTNEESCDQEEEEQPLMKANNYQFC